MKIEFDPEKSAKNERERGLPFTMAKYFDFEKSIRLEDLRRNYGEQRILGYGYIGTRLHVLCYKPITHSHIRVISLRKANEKEEKFYAKEIRTLNQ